MKPNSPVHRELGAVVAAEGWNQPDILAHVPDADTDAAEQFVRRWTHMLIAMIAHGGAAQVKQLLIKANATESLEPLWLSARAELGEDPGPLPVEVLDAVDEVRRMVAEGRT